MSFSEKFLNGTGLSRVFAKVKNFVKANPTLAGTESNLTSIEVDGTKYKVPQTTIGGVGGVITLGTGLSMTGSELSAAGGEQHLYWHSIQIKDSEYNVSFIILNESASAFTKDDMKSLLNSNAEIIATGGVVTYSGTNYTPYIIKKTANDYSHFDIMYFTQTSTNVNTKMGTYSAAIVTDTVNQIF